MKIYDSKTDTVKDVADGLGAAMLKHNNIKNGGRYGEVIKEETAPEPVAKQEPTDEEPKPKRRRKKKTEHTDSADQ